MSSKLIPALLAVMFGLTSATTALAHDALQLTVTPEPIILPDPDTYTTGERLSGDEQIAVLLQSVVWQARNGEGFGAIYYQSDGTVEGIWNGEPVHGTWQFNNAHRSSVCTMWNEPIIRGGHKDCYWIFPKIDNETGEIIGYTVDGSYTP